ncbi:hypothetical protein BU23DRAFT_550176 [Bimuria novae-zelandiae CBS 107.79]|uniref:Ubiquitin-like domain-containing protein n=1 Tax=Bimuria novae-zelandiae CBS 107.79 TaxID=1447943 RepID=A0A6A5VQW9_9PLEO|nr:hypothetical protein BU23DRAFT_550176 [Bimuria novae-zelandiae CBS 107.79]
MTAAMELPEQLVYLIIRFATSIPDLPLAVRLPQTTTTLSLKQLIRPHLPFSHAASRLRLIYAGKVLADAVPLSVSLRLPPPSPPLRPQDDAPSAESPASNAKGKQPIRDISPDIPPDAKRYYIHCSLGDALSASELASEATLASTTEASLKSQYENAKGSRGSRGSVSSGNGNGARRRSSAANASAAPQGFDRLLSSGFTPQEVATLRSQFQTNLSYTHTPDTMPSAGEMRALEDRWLDSTATDPAGALAGEGGETGWGAGFAVEEGGLDDMLWGYLTGFFWPLGSLVWGFREEGVWARRRQVAVVMGVVLNAAFGFMRWSQ